MNKDALSQLWPLLEEALEQAPNELRRLFHGRGQCYEGLEQMTIDWLQGQLVVHIFKPAGDDFLVELNNGLLALTESTAWSAKMGRAILVQHRYLEGSPFETVFGVPELKPVVEELGLKYQLELGKNQNFGLFLDMRLGREWVGERSKQKKVLNLFSYTCGFSVAAVAGGADQVVNVDMAKGALSRGRENHRLNGHSTNQVAFLGHDIFKSWGKIKKYGPYDLIIIDPPSFQKGSFALTKDYQKILRRLPDLLEQGGEVLACVNAPSVTPDFLIDSMKEEAPALTFQYRLDNPIEFKDSDPNSSLKALVFA